MLPCWKDHLGKQTSQESLSSSSPQLLKYHIQGWGVSEMILASSLSGCSPERPWPRNIWGVQSIPRTMRHNTRRWLLLFHSTNFIAVVPRALVSPFFKSEWWMFFVQILNRLLLSIIVFPSEIVFPPTLNFIYYDDFVCLLDWAMGCPDTWPDIILGVSVRVFWDEISISLSRFRSANCPP